MRKLKGIFINTDGVVIPYQYNDTLQELQDIVKGYIQYYKISDRLYIICDEEGKLKNRPINKVASRLTGGLEMIVGNVLVVATDGENNADCTYKDLQYVLDKGKLN